MKKHDDYASNSGKYVDFLTFTSSSAISMLTSTAVPQASGAVLRARTIDLGQLPPDERPIDAGDHPSA